tara:strand:+ start:545 stop:1786 length:1242 start_codon:yes stop_codon:yes gene_type:complete
MKKIFIIISIFISAYSQAAIQLLDRIAVIVDDGLIMESQVNKGIEEILERYREQNIPISDESIVRDQIIESLIIEELQLQLGNRAGVRISDTELNDTLTRIAKNNQMDLEEFISFIDSGNGSYEELRETVRKQMIVQRVQRGRVANEIDITEKEFDTYLKNDDSLVSLEPELLVRQILVKTISDANIAIEQINNGKNFEVLAREISIAGDKDNAGLMEWRKAFNMPKLFSDAIKNMPVGYISSPLKSGAGYHILKLEQKRGDFVQYEDQWLSRHILLMPSAIRNTEKTKIELNEIRNKIINGEKFENLAKEFSEDPGSAKAGGDLGWLGKGVLAPEFENMMIGTDLGIISDIFETQFGFHFLEVLDKRNHDKTRELIEDEAYQRLYARKYEEELENTLRGIRADAFVEIKKLD